MALDVVQFVDSIASAPTVRLDLNNEAPWAAPYEGTDFSPPRLRRAVVSTLLRDGAAYPASAYDDRTIRLRLELQTSTVDGQATALQALAREVDRPSNFLRWQPVGATNPVFFRTVRSDLARITEVPGSGTFRVVDVELLAEPFAYGLRETGSPVTVNNDPAAGSNGLFLDVTGVKGDVETPAFIEFTSIVVSAPGRKTVIATRRRGTPAQMPFVLQAEAMTAGTDTSLQANDANFSGAGQNWMRCTFATNAAMTTRLSIADWPPSAAVDVRGTYRVFARVRRNDGTSESMALRLQWGVTGKLFTGDTVSTWPASVGVFTLVDLGLVAIPTTMDPVWVGPSGVEIPARGLRYLEVQAQRVSGALTLDFDFLLFVPADDSLLIFDWPTGTDTLNTTVVDGYNETVHPIRTAVAAVDNVASQQVIGGFPMLSPGQTNRLVFVPHVGAGGDLIADTNGLTVSYWPRYLSVRPPSS